MSTVTTLRDEVVRAADRVPFGTLAPHQRDEYLERAVVQALRHVNDTDVIMLAQAMAPEAFAAEGIGDRAPAMSLLARTQVFRLDHARWRGPVYRGSDGAGAAHCADCGRYGHPLAHPELGCGDVGCDEAHGAPSDADLDVAAGSVRFAVRSALAATDPTPVTVEQVREVVDMVVEGWPPVVVDRIGGAAAFAISEHSRMRGDRLADGEAVERALEALAGDLAWWRGSVTITAAQHAVVAAQRDRVEQAARLIADARAALETAGVR